jgi:hypothetical protein
MNCRYAPTNLHVVINLKTEMWIFAFVKVSGLNNWYRPFYVGVMNV